MRPPSIFTHIQHYVLDVSPEIPQAGVPGTALAQPVLQFDGNQNLTVRFLIGLDPTGNAAVEAQESVPSPTQAGPVTWAADDNLGTPRDEVDNSGSLANHAVFAAFGKDIYNSSPAVIYWTGFGGAHLDTSTGLMFTLHRPYDPATGRWLSPDPSDFKAGDADLNRYAGNDPTGKTDPTGLAPPGDPFGPGGPYYNPYQNVPLPPGPMPLPEASYFPNPYSGYMIVKVTGVRHTIFGMEIHYANGTVVFWPSPITPLAPVPTPKQPRIYDWQIPQKEPGWRPYVKADVEMYGNPTGNMDYDYKLIVGVDSNPNNGNENENDSSGDDRGSD